MKICNKISGPLLMICLLLSFSGKAQDSLLIHFEFGRSTLDAGARMVIDSALSRYGLSRPMTSLSRSLVRIDLSGYCDSIGGDEFNDLLSGERIAATRDYLRSKGLPDSLFGVMEKWGKRRPLNDNGDENKRGLNRRVEIVFYYGVGRTPYEVGRAPAVPSPRKSTASLTLTEFFRDSAKTGKTFVLRNLNFEVGRHVLLPYSDTALKELLKIMLDSPRLKIEIRGHVCCIAPELDGLDFDTRTEDLSVRRARLVYEYLRQRGVKGSRMSYHGFGASQKLYPQERNEKEEELNRRVEIKRKNPQD